MEVSTYKCLISVFVVMILSQVAVAVEQFDLLPCSEGDSGGMLYCIEYDSVGDVSYLHDNITRRITIRLPILVMTQLWLSQGDIAIVTPSGDVINNGQELIRPKDQDRWTITFTFQHVNSNFGKLHLDFHITDVTYTDMLLLHVEIRTQDNIFVTTGKTWFPVHDTEGEARTTDNPTDDPSAILQARIETLQEEKMTAENASNHYQTKYYHCLEAKDDLNETINPEIEGEGKVVSILLIVTMTSGITVLMVGYTTILLSKNFKLLKNTHTILANLPKVSFSAETSKESHTSTSTETCRDILKL